MSYSHRGLPRSGGNSQDGQADRLGDVQADRELEAFRHDGVDEAVRRPGGVGPHQHLHARLGVIGFGHHRKLRDRRVEQLHVVSGSVRPRSPRAQLGGQRLARLVQEHQQRVVAEPPLVGRAGLLLLRVHVHQAGVEVQRDLLRRQPRRPDPSARRRPRRLQRRQQGLVDGVEDPPRRRLGGHLPEQPRLVSEHLQVQITVIRGHYD